MEPDYDVTVLVVQTADLERLARALRDYANLSGPALDEALAVVSAARTLIAGLRAPSSGRPFIVAGSDGEG